ncbi:MAG: nucleoside deaminase [Mariprofundus sp.]
MNESFSDLRIQMPAWALDLTDANSSTYSTAESRMQLAIALARNNIEHATGGPFGAAVFDMHTHQLLSIGINLVVSSNCSVAHAEIMAITLAQQKLAQYDLARGAERYELVSSCEPCAMCFGALPWSGIRHLVCGARDADARAIGFDEGPKMDNWQSALASRGISVETDVCRSGAVTVLQQYAAQGGAIYNAGKGQA